MVNKILTITTDGEILTTTTITIVDGETLTIIITSDGDPIMIMDGETLTTTTITIVDGETLTIIITSDGDPIMITDGETLTTTTITTVDGETTNKYPQLHSRWEISRS